MSVREFDPDDPGFIAYHRDHLIREIDELVECALNLDAKTRPSGAMFGALWACYLEQQEKQKRRGGSAAAE